MFFYQDVYSRNPSDTGDRNQGGAFIIMGKRNFFKVFAYEQKRFALTYISN